MPDIPRFPLKFFFRDKFILWPTLLSLGSILGLWIYLPLAIKHKEQLVFLHYTVHLGVDLVGSWQQILGLPLIGSIFFIVNLFMAYLLYYDKFFSRLLVITTTVIQVILWLEAIFLVFLNF